jgi:hypothetical protein
VTFRLQRRLSHAAPTLDSPGIRRLARVVQKSGRQSGEMLIKIDRGTPRQDADALCDTCRHSRIRRGRRLEEELVICDALGMHPVQIIFKVTSCSDYIDDREPSYHELFEKAWILRPASKQRAAGFVRASDLTAKETALFFDDPGE